MTDQRTLTIDVGQAAPQGSTTATPGLLLCFCEGSAPGGRVYGGGPDCTVGRGPDQQLYIEDPALSRAHARFCFEQHHVWLEDLGSHNGTWVNGRKIDQRTRVVAGDVVRCGNSLLLPIDAIEPYEGWPESGARPPLVGGPAIGAVRTMTERVAARDSVVLVSGESGTGKELVAEMLHAASGRRGALVPVNCAAVPEGLFESELFGAEKGAYTDATQTRIGLIGEAEGGTLFLDEIGELPAALQSKLLRFVELKEVRRVGAAKVSRADVRVVAATNGDLRIDVSKGDFRADLYQRLSGIRVQLPALRERRDDVVLLVDWLVPRHSEEMPARFSADSMHCLLLHDWPGNVRELRRVVAEARLRAEMEGADCIEPSFLRLEQVTSKDDEQFERISVALREASGNVVAAASSLGMPRSRLYAELKARGIEARSYRQKGPSS